MAAMLPRLPTSPIWLIFLARGVWTERKQLAQLITMTALFARDRPMPRSMLPWVVEDSLLHPWLTAKVRFTPWKFNHRKYSSIRIRQSTWHPRSQKVFNADVCPSITFTYGGISIDSQGHALTRDKKVIPGLLVAGVDAGGFSNLGYAGGLALAFVTGLWSARAVARELGLPEPRLPAADVKDAVPLESKL